ncbi:hypothetical protein AVEN_152435-1 [Araneus ventricosus]|uniref:Uncharacterized protein n=1 Tax=Araneus ventricosus TaxID=182803 RepID=A0A4Y2VYH1_ARAVE|nr:hypothetical protein AVEN_152435-1 [Araneus ventricosus]
MKLLSLCLSALRRFSMSLRNCAMLRKRSKPEEQLKLCCLQCVISRFFCLLCLWNNVLKEVKHVQKYLQILGIIFEESVIKTRSLKVFLKGRRNDLVEEALQFAKDTCEEMGIPVVKRHFT